MKKLLLALMISVVLGISSAHAVQTDQPAPDFTLTDSNGNSHSLSNFAGKYVVLEWVNYECPFVKKFYKSNKMQELQKEFTGKDVVWLSINSSAKGKQGNFSNTEVNEILGNADASPTAYLQDADGKVGKAYGAKTTPHMFVVNPEGQLIYQGAIDSVASADPTDIPSADNYVALALAQAMSGEAVSASQTKSYGCSVKY